MSQIPNLLWTVILFAQTEPATPPELPTPPGDPAAPAAPAETQETDAERLIREAADRVETIEFVSANVRQAIRSGDRTILSTGVYRKGPKYQSYFALDVKLAGGDAKRIHACDGTTGIMYEKFFDVENLRSFQVSDVMPLVESRELPPETKRQLFLQLPFVQPAEMMRGFLDTIRFDQQRDDQLGEDNPRPVTVVEGAWRKKVIPIIAQNGYVQSIDELTGATPQYARLWIDKESSFPLKLELFRRDQEAEYKPIYVLEFLDVENRELLAEDFTFQPPESVRGQDVTSQLVAQLSQFPMKEGAEEKPAGTQEVAEPLK